MLNSESRLISKRPGCRVILIETYAAAARRREGAIKVAVAARAFHKIEHAIRHGVGHSVVIGIHIDGRRTRRSAHRTGDAGC